MKVSREGVNYGKDHGNFTPWCDPTWGSRWFLYLGWTAFGLSAVTGNLPGVVASALAMETVRVSRLPGAVSESEGADIADTVEC